MMHLGEDASSRTFSAPSQVRESGAREAAERRQSPRYEIDLAIRFRVLPASTASEWRAGTVVDLSSTGVSFQCGQPLPVNTRIEMVIDWPSKQSTLHPICLRASGDVVRNSERRVAVQMTASRMGIEKATSAVSAASGSRL
jgi:hypothetical protein